VAILLPLNYVVDNMFYPAVDISVEKYTSPRVRGFQMLDMAGNIIFNHSGTLNPIYYPSTIDFWYQADVLSTI